MSTSIFARRTVLFGWIARLSANTLVLVLWLWLYRAVFDYLAIIFSREDFRTNQIVLVAVLALVALEIRKEHLHPQFDAAPQWYVPALTLALGGSALYLIVERFLNINTISASLFGLASYGLLGLWMKPQRWRQGFPAALLIVGVLPFGEHLQTFVGYPLRILTASIVRDGLTAAGVSSVGVDTILVFENGVSQVDLPCSGVKSLWTGALFLIAATWVERRPLNWRWLLIAIILAALLFVTNLARVGVLVVVGQVMSWRLVAEMIHVPLGVLGFVASCAAAVVLLRLVPLIAQDEFVVSASAQSTAKAVTTNLAHPSWLSPALMIALAALALLYAPRPHGELAQPTAGFVFPAELMTQPMPLTPDQVRWFTDDGAESVVRQRFEWRGLTGSMIFVTSTTWRAQHRPERCFQVYGLALNGSRTHLVALDFPLRFVWLGDRSAPAAFAAAYWFQSVDRIIDDYGTRIWVDLSPTRERWVLVTVVSHDIVHTEVPRHRTHC